MTVRPQTSSCGFSPPWISISMAFAHRLRSSARAFVLAPILATVLLFTVLVSRSAGGLQSQIDGARGDAASLQSAITADTARIRKTSTGLHDAEQRLTALQGELAAREAQLRSVQSALVAARDHLVQLENRLQQASRALAANLRDAYEGG